jgi:hypothetical protein
MSPFYIKTSVCGTPQWKEVTGFYVKREGGWCEVNEAHVKTSVCGDISQWKLYYSNTKVEPGIVLWNVGTGAVAGTVVADGSSISAATQPTLHALLTDSNNLNSNGDPLFGGTLTNPNLPNIQGSNRFIRARSGNSVSTGVGVLQGHGLPSHTHSYRVYPGFGSGLQIPGPPSSYIGFGGRSASNLRVASTNSTGEISGGTSLPSAGSETRPNNIAFRPVLAVQEVPTVPVGSFVWWTSDTVPSGYLLCDGSAVTATHAALRTLLIDSGSPFGTSGSDPRLPDLVTDNRFIRGAGGSLAHGTTQAHNIESHSHDYTGRVGGNIGDSGPRNAAQHTTYLSGPASGGNPGSETRPNCIALLPILKT